MNRLVRIFVFAVGAMLLFHATRTVNVQAGGVMIYSSTLITSGPPGTLRRWVAGPPR
jgi:hypothetical protein